MTMQPCDRTGNFRAEILDYGLKEMDSGAVAVSLHVLLTEMWDVDNWIPWRDYDMEAFGDIWIVKKDKKLNDRQVKALIECAGWDASLSSLTDGSWKPTPCQVEITRETYKNEDRYRISWVNDFNKTPGGGALSNVDANKLRELEARFGSPLRALQGNAKRNGSSPASSKPAPPPRTPVPSAAGEDDGIRF